ncbi:type II secretion system protein [Massilia sp. RP-1-19]|uniref:Type II secretion system protein n=1 Tax=Massilia polaris TaxID=2728846 RepID=A0A848HQH2_9BURK|nr:type II secretion system protein [Massilia polaris]NML60848.1 type II secretion system protein [Massilia polaris]
MFIKPLRQRGVTLIELIMFIVIIGAALAGLLQVLNFTTKGSADPVRQKQALMIAEGLLEEVRLAGFTYCDPTDPKAVEPTTTSAADCTIQESFGQGRGGEPVGSRPYDNINDYVDEPGVAKAAFNNTADKLADTNGTPMEVDGYSAQVTISPAALNGIGGTGADSDVLHIKVEVSYDGQTLALDAYRTRYAPTFP